MAPVPRSASSLDARIRRSQARPMIGNLRSICGTSALTIACAHAAPCPTTGSSSPAPTAAPAPPVAPQAEAAIRAAITTVLDDWHLAASEADEARYFDHFAARGIFLGTDATERWTVGEFRKYAHPHFAKGKAWSFRSTRRAIVVGADRRHAWFDEDLATPNLGPARGSGILVLESGRWKVAHYNLTITVPNAKMDAVKRLLSGDPEPPAETRPR